MLWEIEVGSDQLWGGFLEELTFGPSLKDEQKSLQMENRYR